MNKVEYVPGYPLDLSPGSKENVFSSMQKVKLEHERVYRLITDKLNISADELDEIRGEIGKNSDDLNKKFNDAINGIKIPGKTLTIKKNGTVLGTYTGFSDVVIDIPVESGGISQGGSKEYTVPGVYTFTTPSTCKRVKITACAGGGGGGGSTLCGGASGPPGANSGGSGGSGGSVNSKYFDVQPSTNYAVLIGAGGIGGAGGNYSGNSYGTSGGETKFGDLLTMSGGGGGSPGKTGGGDKGADGNPSGTFALKAFGSGGGGAYGNSVDTGKGGDGHGGYMLIEW